MYTSSSDQTRFFAGNTRTIHSGFTTIPGACLIMKSASSITQDEFHDQELEILFNVIHRYVGYFTRKSMKKSQDRAAGEYPFIPMDLRQVYSQLRWVHDYLNTKNYNQGQAPKFVDVGCGIGNILLLAEQFKFSVYGLEKGEYPCAIAGELIDPDRIVQVDIRDYQGYGNFDILYYYRQLSNREPQMKLEEYIEDEMQPNAILIANHKMSQAVQDDSRFERLHQEMPIWQKKHW